MRKPSAILALISMLFAVPIISADDHLVSRGAVNQRLNDAVAERTRNIASLDALLTSPGAEKAAATGIDIERARKALPRLSDGDLSDLAQRAAALKADPVAGHYRYHNDAADALIVVMVVSAMALVILAATNNI